MRRKYLIVGHNVFWAWVFLGIFEWEYLEKCLYVVYYETSVANYQKEKYEAVSTYTDAVTYKFSLFASLVITGH